MRRIHQSIFSIVSYFSAVTIRKKLDSRICFAMLLHIESDLGNMDLKTLLETRSYESKIFIKDCCSIISVLCYICTCLLACFVFSLKIMLVAEMKFLPFSEGQTI